MPSTSHNDRQWRPSTTLSLIRTINFIIIVRFYIDYSDREPTLKLFSGRHLLFVDAKSYSPCLSRWQRNLATEIFVLVATPLSTGNTMISARQPTQYGTLRPTQRTVWQPTHASQPTLHLHLLTERSRKSNRTSRRWLVDGLDSQRLDLTSVRKGKNILISLL